MIRDVSKANQSSEAAAMEIMRLNNAMETIYALYYQQDKAAKESNLAKYTELLERRKDVDDDLDIVVAFYSAICESLKSMKFSKQDKKLHKQRMRKMKEMYANDDFSFMDAQLVGEDLPEEVPETKPVVETKKK